MFVLNFDVISIFLYVVVYTMLKQFIKINKMAEKKTAG